MSEYGKYTTRKPPPLLFHDSFKEAKAARKKLLEQIEQIEPTKILVAN